MSIKNNVIHSSTWQSRLEVVAARIRELNHPKLMSDRACAAFIGVTPNVWSQWKTGQTKHPKSEQLKKIHETTGLNPHWLMTGEGEPLDAESCVIRETPAQYANSIDELMGKTWTVLTSGTVYASALSANVDAFHQAVVAESEKSRLEDRIDKLEKLVTAKHGGGSQEQTAKAS